MNAISYPIKIKHGRPEGMQPDTVAELLRHSVDLRVHALIMLGNALFAGYCGFRASGAYNDGMADDPAPIMAPPDMLSLCVCVIFIAVSLACVVEAHRFWRKAAIIRSRTRVERTAHPSVTNQTLGAVGKPALAQLHNTPSSLQILKGW